MYRTIAFPLRVSVAAAVAACPSFLPVCYITGVSRIMFGSTVVRTDQLSKHPWGFHGSLFATDDMAHLLKFLLKCDLERLIVEPGETRRWYETWKGMATYLQEGSFEPTSETLDLIRHLSHQQEILAQSMINIEHFAEEKMDQMAETLSVIKLETEGSVPRMRKRDDRDNDGETPTSSSETKQISEPPEEPDEHLRDWYVSHLSYPFPDKPSKQALATPINYTKQQLNTWFTNMRRRSGYTEHLRTFAGGNKRRFEEMIIAVLDGEVGEGGRELVEAVEDMRKYVAKKPRGKVGEWLMNLMEGEEKVDHNPRKKRRVVKDTSDDLKPSTSEQPLVPEPTSAPTAEAPTTPIAKSKIRANKAATPKTIKTYTFSIGASDSPTPSSNTKRRPLGSPFRTSPLRTVSTNSTSSLETVDSGLRSVSGVSAANSMSSNISSDLNFSFPTYNVNTPQLHVPLREIPTVILTPPAPTVDLPPVMHQQQYHHQPQQQQQQQQTLYTFGMQENSQFTFNPNLPHTVRLAPSYHPTMPYNPSYQQEMFYPSSLSGVVASGIHNFQQQQQQEYIPYQGSAELRFSDGFGTTMTMKRSIGEVGGLLVDERAWKVPRFEEV
ncbi:hypothetical protein QFC22_001661 [Naganishia vaughanmartiniae]|uniref:Uncharacterized protein n=1 Tax=Naganishia vaughanmartiniae TaxID=1424756 RepID=A0ACC2XF34_9TREE|nr:hypothetical protein QFC22_001661 [Naganishia vaughanmartiniae]